MDDGVMTNHSVQLNQQLTQRSQRQMGNLLFSRQCWLV